MSLRVSRTLMGAVEAHARASYPEECCGVLVGPIPDDFEKPGRRVEAAEARPLDNAWESPARGHRYQIEPAFVAKLEKEFRGTGRGIVGWYHSPPDVPAWPSPFDLMRAWPCYSYLIVSVKAGANDGARSWMRSEDGNDFLQEAIEVV